MANVCETSITVYKYGRRILENAPHAHGSLGSTGQQRRCFLKRTLGESYETMRLLLQCALTSRPRFDYNSSHLKYIYAVQEIVKIEAFWIPENGGVHFPFFVTQFCCSCFVV